MRGMRGWLFLVVNCELCGCVDVWSAERWSRWCVVRRAHRRVPLHATPQTHTSHHHIITYIKSSIAAQVVVRAPTKLVSPPVNVVAPQIGLRVQVRVQSAICACCDTGCWCVRSKQQASVSSLTCCLPPSRPKCTVSTAEGCRALGDEGGFEPTTTANRAQYLTSSPYYSLALLLLPS
jgi:hypothetical protein